MKEVNLELWQGNAEDILAVLVTEQYVDKEQNAFNLAFHENGLMPYQMPPGRWRSMLDAIITLRLSKRAVNWNNIALVAEGAVTQEWYTQLVTLCDVVRIADFPENLTNMIEVGNRMVIAESMEASAQNLRKGDDIDSTINLLVTDITTVGESKIVNETAAGAKTRLSAIFDQPPKPSIPTGIDWLDEIGILQEERMLVLAGAYKSRKTTIALNFTYGAYKAGKRPAFLSFENSIDVTMMQMTAMLAVLYIRDVLKIPYSLTASAYWISAEKMMQAGSGYKDWTEARVQAIDYARAEMERIGDGIRFYDTSATGGDLNGMNSIRSVIQRDMRLYGGNYYTVDHQGLVDVGGEIYESTRSVSKFLQRISRVKQPHPIHLTVLAQLNEGAIASGGGYSAGIKGGGDSSANADYVLRTTPVALNAADGEYYDDRIELQLKHNRWGPSTGRNTVMFQPDSGVIMPSTTHDLRLYGVIEQSVGNGRSQKELVVQDDF